MGRGFGALKGLYYKLFKACIRIFGTRCDGYTSSQENSVTRATIEMKHLFSHVPQSGRSRHVLLNPKTDLEKSKTAMILFRMTKSHGLGEEKKLAHFFFFFPTILGQGALSFHH